MSNRKDHICLKWGTLKGWNLHSKRGKELIRRYEEIGSSFAAMMQDDTPEQKRLICKMIDVCNAKKIYLEWDGVYVSKAKAKRYVMQYKKIS